ncbi:ABC transporter ATP-binding protein [Pusillimonas sp.]|uniref:ABC transporter ATP-binding protein n=1 Tax=Pusillimonas sp. TaxID=3040095 RepID=UPI0029B6AF90|nr:ABC transporter ATP-binding protein [Pusillimonas sp.]MDX3895599.1 ABC transporter ATP-binding protein [Pusillimonas sp.]
MTHEHALRLEGVSAGYGHTTILEELGLSVAPGERLGIIGRNGAGKTTTLATAMGLTQMRKGRVLLGDTDLTALRPSARAAKGLGYVPQTRDIFPSLTVEENLRAGQNRKSGESSARLLDQAYQLFPRLYERRANWGNELSGGEQQMLSIARALMGSPAILLLDEPLEGLAPVVAQELMAAIKVLAEERGIGTVLVEQQVNLVLDFSTRVLVLERGRGVFYGAPEELRSERSEILDLSVGIRKVAGTARSLA